STGEVEAPGHATSCGEGRSVIAGEVHDGAAATAGRYPPRLIMSVLAYVAVAFDSADSNGTVSPAGSSTKATRLCGNRDSDSVRAYIRLSLNLALRRPKVG